MLLQPNPSEWTGAAPGVRAGSWWRSLTGGTEQWVRFGLDFWGLRLPWGRPSERKQQSQCWALRCALWGSGNAKFCTELKKCLETETHLGEESGKTPMGLEMGEGLPGVTSEHRTGRHKLQGVACGNRQHRGGDAGKSACKSTVCRASGVHMCVMFCEAML